MQPQRFAAGLTPLPTAARVTRQRGALRWRIVSSLISAALLAALAWFGRDTVSTGWLIFLVVAFAVTTVFWMSVSIIGLHNAKKDLARIQEGVAFYLDQRGIEFHYPVRVDVDWADVSALKLVGRSLGAGPDLAVERHGEIVARVPLSFLDATPQYIDSAAQAYSLGRVRLDTEALDSVL